MKILIGTQAYNYLSGCPMYCYELARELSLLGHEVTIVSRLSLMSGAGRDLQQNTINHGIRMVDIWDIDTIKEEKFDVFHLNQLTTSQKILEAFGEKVPPCVYTMHSEFQIETPLFDKRIKKYIGIRPSIVEKWQIPNTELIYNPIDTKRFCPKPKPNNDPKIVLFVGTIDTLRKPAGLHLIEMSKKEGFEVWFMGDIFHSFLKDIKEPNIKHIPANWETENWIEEVDETAGILYGRTTVEGWLMDRPGWIYDIDLQGEIKSVELFQPPTDIKEKHDSKIVVDKIIKIYEQII